jgi:Tol biopolymer transport system component
MKKIDWIASSVIAAALILLGVVIFLGSRVPITVSCQHPAPCDAVGQYGAVTFEFSRPAQAEGVEALWQTIPQVEGRWQWLDERHATWRSIEPLASGQTIVFQFQPGQAGKNGESIRQSIQWEAAVREPQVVATRSDDNGKELFTISLADDPAAAQLTYTNGLVFDFQASPDGEQVAFSVVNDQKGFDLWIIGRDGSNQRMLLECGLDRCSAAAWSPDQHELAYTRESAGVDPDGPRGAPRIWILDVQSGQTAALFSDSQKIGYGPKWSPDGQWLSIWNGVEGGIQVVNRKSGETFLLPSSNGDVGCWTADSQYLYYSDMVGGEAGFRNVVYRADIASQTITTMLGGNVEGGGLSVDGPECSLTDAWVAVRVQPNVKIPGAELFLLNPGTQSGLTITDDLSRIPGFHSFTPDGELLVFQSDVLGGKETDVEIWVWERTDGEARLLITGYRSPQWLP